MSSVSAVSPFNKQRRPPTDGKANHISPPVYFFDGTTNYVWIITNDSGLWQYDLDQQTIKAKCKYPSDIDTSDGWGFIDEQNGILYIHFAREHLVSVNLQARDGWHLMQPTWPYANITFVPSPINESHLTLANMHFRLRPSVMVLSDNTGTDKNHQLMLNLGFYVDQPSKFVYNSETKQLMMFQAYCRHILFCEITAPNQRSVNWRKYDTELPLALDGILSFSVVLAWNQILFLFYFGDNVIWCLDLLNNNKWYPFLCREFDIPKAEHAIKDKHNNIHLLTLTSDVGIEPSHLVASLHDLVPSEIIEMNRNRNDPLVIGYIKECEKQQIAPSIHVYLKHLILQFYPLFL